MAQFTIESTHFTVPDDPTELFVDPIFTVRSSPRDYAIDFGAGERVDETIKRILHSFDSTLVVSDRFVADTYLHDIVGDVPILKLDATEELKTLEGSFALLEHFADCGLTKNTMVVAFGGGVIQDTVGFACGIYKRGTPWTYVPTTLLAQGDSCIGSKTAINFRGTKNLLGSFSAPRSIVLHAGFLASLDPEEIVSGLGEIFRLCVTAGDAYLSAFEERVEAATKGDIQALEEVVRISLGVKRAVIEVDEFETDLRRALNFGHSIGHALEVATDYEIRHGTAVCIGVIVEAEISKRMGQISEGDFHRLIENARHLITPEIKPTLARVEASTILALLGRDKKVEGSILKLPIPCGLGAIRFVDFPLDDAAPEVLEASFAQVLELL